MKPDALNTSNSHISPKESGAHLTFTTELIFSSTGISESDLQKHKVLCKQLLFTKSMISDACSLDFTLVCFPHNFQVQIPFILEEMKIKFQSYICSDYSILCGIQASCPDDISISSLVLLLNQVAFFIHPLIHLFFIIFAAKLHDATGMHGKYFLHK